MPRKYHLPPKRERIDGDRFTEVVESLHTIYTADGVPLVMSRRHAPEPKPKAPPVLLVHGLAQNRYSWHLPGRSLANYLVDEGFDVYNVELRGHGLSRTHGSPYPETFEEYIDYDVPAAIDAAVALSGQPRVFVLGHSFGGTIGYCLAPVQDRIAGVVSFGGPGQFGAGNQALRAFGQFVRFLDRGTALRFLPYTMFPSEPIAAALIGLLGYLDRPNRFPLQIWHPGSIRRDILEDRIRLGFDRSGRKVIRQTYHWGASQTFTCVETGADYTERLREFTAPVLFVQGDRDLVVPHESIRICLENMASDDMEVREFNQAEHGAHFGHIDIVLGDEAPAHIWPYVRDWMQARAGAATKPRKTKRAGAPPEPAAAEPEGGDADGEDFVGFTL